MGNSLTVDSEVSRIEDILEMSNQVVESIHVKKESLVKEIWRLNTIDECTSYFTFKPIPLLDVTTKDLVFGDDEMVIVLLLFRGTNRGAIFFKKTIKKGKLTRVKTSVRIRLPENIKHKLRGQFVKNMLFRMLFNDRMDEQVEYNFKTINQVTTMPLWQVEDVMYVLESVPHRKQNKKPLTQRQHDGMTASEDKNMLILEGSEGDGHERQLRAQGHDGNSLFFIESSREDNRQPDEGGPVIFQDVERNHEVEKPEKKVRTGDFVFGPIEYPLLNEKCEGTWRARSTSRHSSTSREKALKPGDGAGSDSNSMSKSPLPGNKPKVRQAESAGNESSSNKREEEGAWSDRQSRPSSAVSAFKALPDESEEGAISKDKRGKIHSASPSNRPSFKDIVASPVEQKLVSPARSGLIVSPDLSSSSKKQSISGRKPGDGINQATVPINIKEEVIHEAEGEEDSDDIERIEAQKKMISKEEEDSPLIIPETLDTNPPEVSKFEHCEENFSIKENNIQEKQANSEDLQAINLPPPMEIQPQREEIIVAPKFDEKAEETDVKPAQNIVNEDKKETIQGQNSGNDLLNVKEIKEVLESKKVEEFPQLPGTTSDVIAEKSNQKDVTKIQEDHPISPIQGMNEPPTEPAPVMISESTQNIIVNVPNTQISSDEEDQKKEKPVPKITEEPAKPETIEKVPEPTSMEDSAKKPVTQPEGQSELQAVSSRRPSIIRRVVGEMPK